MTEYMKQDENNLLSDLVSDETLINDYFLTCLYLIGESPFSIEINYWLSSLNIWLLSDFVTTKVTKVFTCTIKMI